MFRSLGILGIHLLGIASCKKFPDNSENKQKNSSLRNTILAPCTGGFPKMVRGYRLRLGWSWIPKGFCRIPNCALHLRLILHPRLILNLRLTLHLKLTLHLRLTLHPKLTLHLMLIWVQKTPGSTQRFQLAIQKTYAPRIGVRCAIKEGQRLQKRLPAFPTLEFLIERPKQSPVSC